MNDKVRNKSEQERIYGAAEIIPRGCIETRLVRSGGKDLYDRGVKDKRGFGRIRAGGGLIKSGDEIKDATFEFTARKTRAFQKTRRFISSGRQTYNVLET